MRLREFHIALILMVMLSSAWPCFAQDTRTQESRKARLEQEIALINKQLEENSSKSNSALTQLSLVQTKISNRKALLDESEREIRAISSQIASKQMEIKQLEERHDTLLTYYARLVQSAYKNRDSKVWYMYILASDNVGQAFRRLGYLRDLSKQMDVQSERILETKREIEEENIRLKEMMAEAQLVRNRRQQEMRTLQREEEQSRSLVNRLRTDRRKYEKELSTKKKQVEALNKEIERIIREATKSTSKGASSKSIDYTLDAEFSKNKGKLPWPAEGPIVEKYGQNYHPVYKNVKLPFNNGVTMAVSMGTSVTAIFDGVVKQIVVMPGYNKCVLVQHGNYFSFYCKLSDVKVKAGDKVKTGDVIGVVDTMDGTTQFHFQVWKGTTPQNPETWLR